MPWTNYESVGSLSGPFFLLGSFLVLRTELQGMFTSKIFKIVNLKLKETFLI
jgi:hypothetical protein